MVPPPSTPPPPPPDPKGMERLGYVVRFGCGFGVGLFFALAFGLVDFGGSLGQIVLGLVIVAVIFGGLSACFGDPFWRFLVRLARWL
jgi:hypothetical protein